MLERLFSIRKRQEKVEASPKVVFVFRGLKDQRNDGRIGSRWSTDPYYAMGHADINPQTVENLGDSTLYVATVSPETLKGAKQDPYSPHIITFFGDPPNVRPVTTNEIRTLIGYAKYHPNASIDQRPDNLDDVFDLFNT